MSAFEGDHNAPDSVSRFALDETNSAFTDDSVHPTVLSHFDTLVKAVGGDPAAIREALNIDNLATQGANGALQYDHLVRILHGSSQYLNCSDFGLKLAKLQGGLSSLPMALQLVMRNSHTIGEAYQYCSDHLDAYSSVVETTVRPDHFLSKFILRFEIRKTWKVPVVQAVEHAVGLLHNSLIELSGGPVRSREIWFRHSALSKKEVYRAFFGCPVKFDMPINAVIISIDDFRYPIKERNLEIYDIADSFVRSQYPTETRSLRRHIEDVLWRSLDSREASYRQVARMLGMHHRTLQRRLRIEGFTFDQIKDDLRKQEAFKLLNSTQLPISTISQRLGYSEPSVFTRSCYRWFSASPSALRKSLAAAQYTSL